MNLEKLVLVLLLVVVFVLSGCRPSGEQTFVTPISEASSVRQALTPAVSTFTLIPTSTSTPRPTYTITATNTVTCTPTVTGTSTPTITPTSVVYEGYTFYGTQLEFLRRNLGWRYTVKPCISWLVGIESIKSDEPEECLAVISPKKDVVRAGQYYLIRAYFTDTYPDQPLRLFPSDIKLYLHEGPIPDPNNLFEKTNGLTYDQVTEENINTVLIHPAIWTYYRLAREEYEILVEHQDLFSNFLDSALPISSMPKLPPRK